MAFGLVLGLVAHHVIVFVEENCKVTACGIWRIRVQIGLQVQMLHVTVSDRALHVVFGSIRSLTSDYESKILLLSADQCK